MDFLKKQWISIQIQKELLPNCMDCLFKFNRFLLKIYWLLLNREWIHCKFHRLPFQNQWISSWNSMVFLWISMDFYQISKEILASSIDCLSKFNRFPCQSMDFLLKPMDVYWISKEFLPIVGIASPNSIHFFFFNLLISVK